MVLISSVPFCQLQAADLPSSQAQTPQQRKANERYARQEAAKRGKPESAVKHKQKWDPPISKLWIGEHIFLGKAKGRIVGAGWYAKSLTIGVLIFVLCGGVIFELLRLFF